MAVSWAACLLAGVCLLVSGVAVYMHVDKHAVSKQASKGEAATCKQEQTISHRARVTSQPAITPLYHNRHGHWLPVTGNQMLPPCLCCFYWLYFYYYT